MIGQPIAFSGRGMDMNQGGRRDVIFGNRWYPEKQEAL
jgi:hypothetical protein